VLDDNLRNLLDEVRSQEVELATAISELESDNAYKALNDAYDAATARIGEILRALYG
jgi:hypothetical protein